MEPDPIKKLQSSAATARYVAQQKRLRTSQRSDRVNRHAIALGFDADTGLDVIQLPDGSVKLTQANTNGARGIGDALLMHSGEGFTKIDTTPALKPKQTIFKNPPLQKSSVAILFTKTVLSYTETIEHPAQTTYTYAFYRDDYNYDNGYPFGPGHPPEWLSHPNAYIFYSGAPCISPYLETFSPTGELITVDTTDTPWLIISTKRQFFAIPDPDYPDIPLRLYPGIVIIGSFKENEEIVLPPILALEWEGYLPEYREGNYISENSDLGGNVYCNQPKPVPNSNTGNLHGADWGLVNSITQPAYAEVINHYKTEFWVGGNFKTPIKIFELDAGKPFEAYISQDNNSLYVAIKHVINDGNIDDGDNNGGGSSGDTD